MNGCRRRSIGNIRNNLYDIEYIDIESTFENERQKNCRTNSQDDEFFYPLVMINDEMIGEGYIQLKPVFNALEKIGYESWKSKNVDKFTFSDTKIRLNIRKFL